MLTIDDVQAVPLFSTLAVPQLERLAQTSADLRLGAGRGAEIILAEDAGLRGDFIEAEAWAYLAVRSLKGLPLTYPSTTGCRRAVSGGVMARAGT